MDPTTTAVSASGLGLRTRAGWVYQDVDLDIPAGTLTVVTGPARSGKTALLLTLAGRMKAGRGRLTVNGIDACRHPGRVRKVVGMGEFRGVNDLDDTISVGDQVKAELALYGRSWRETEIDHVLEPLSLKLDHHDDVGSLTAPERVLFAAALGRISSPPLLIVDELDEDTTPEETAQVLLALRSLTEQGVTIVAGTLNPDLAAEADCSVALAADGSATESPATSPHNAERPQEVHADALV